MLEQRKLQGWQADPFGLHEKRYFSGGRPTKLVRDGDTESYDDPPGQESLPPAYAIDAPGEIDPTEAGTIEAETADAEEPAASAGPADTPAPAAVAAIAIVADAIEKVDDYAPSAMGPESSPAQASSASAQELNDEPEGTAAANSAEADTSADLSSIAPEIPGLGILLRRPRGLVYAAVAIAAVAVVIGIIAATGGFSPHPKPGTFGALAQSGSNPGSGNAPLDTSAAAMVTAAAQRTFAQKSADVNLSGSATAAGLAVPLQGTGQVDFGGYAMTASLGATYDGGAVAENEITTSKSTYFQLAIGGHSLIIQSTGRHWMNIPMAQDAGLSQNITAYSLPWSLQLLMQQPASVASLGTKSIGGVNCNGYMVTPSKQALVTVVQREWAYQGLTAKAKGDAMQALRRAAFAAPITAWFDPHRQLVCEMTVEMQVTNAAPATWTKQPTAANVQITADFTRYGVPVRITPPPVSDSVLF